MWLPGSFVQERGAMSWLGGSSSSGPFGHSYSDPPTQRSKGRKGEADTAEKRKPVLVETGKGGGTVGMLVGRITRQSKVRLPAFQVSSHSSLVRARTTLPSSGPVATSWNFVIGPSPLRVVQPTFPSGTPGIGLKPIASAA